MKRQAYGPAQKKALYWKFMDYLRSQSRGQAQGRGINEQLKKVIVEKQEPAPKPRPKGIFNLQLKGFIFSRTIFLYSRVIIRANSYFYNIFRT